MSAKSRAIRLFEEITVKAPEVLAAVGAASVAQTNAASDAAQTAQTDAQAVAQSAATNMASLQLQMTALVMQMKSAAPARLTGNANAATYNYTFPQPYKSPPLVEPRTSWAGTQSYDAVVSNVTTTGCTLTMVRSKGTLLLSAGPFESATSGGPFTLLVWGTLQS